VLQGVTSALVLLHTRVVYIATVSRYPDSIRDSRIVVTTVPERPNPSLCLIRWSPPECLPTG
jgi:hypothetical protein